MNTYTIAHKMFHDPNGRGKYAGCPLSYDNYNGLRAISYSTPIAEVVFGKDGEPITLISNQKYSITTSKHIIAVMGASPYRVLYVPNCEGSPLFVFRKSFEKYEPMGSYNVTPEYFNQARNRQAFMNLVIMFDEYQKYIGGLDELMGKRNGVIELYIRLCKDIEQKRVSRKQLISKATEQYESTVKKQKSIEKRRTTILAKKASEFLSGDRMDLIGKIKFIFEPHNNLDAKTKELLAKCRSMLNVKYETPIGTRYASYMWIDNKQVRTSQGVRVTIDDVRRLCSMWKHKENIIGQKVDNIYSVLQRTDEYVQVGCHTIPTWNIEAICKALNV